MIKEGTVIENEIRKMITEVENEIKKTKQEFKKVGIINKGDETIINENIIERSIIKIITNNFNRSI